MHPQRADIDLAIVAGEPQRAIASRFGLTRPAIQRHSVHSKAITKTKAKVEAKHERTVLEKVLRLQRIAMRAIKAGEADLDGMGALRELGRLLDLEAKLTGALAPQTLTLKLDTLSDEELEAKYMSALARGQKELDATGSKPS